MAIAEDIESWESLQKGQIAELAFERIALAHDYAVQYRGRQYTGLVEPSKYRQWSASTTAPPGQADFVLKKRVGDEWQDHARIEVKWRTLTAHAPSTVANDAEWLVLFTRDDLYAAEVSDGKVGCLVPLHDIEALGFRRELYGEFLVRTQLLLALQGKPTGGAARPSAALPSPEALPKRPNHWLRYLGTALVAILLGLGIGWMIAGEVSANRLDRVVTMSWGEGKYGPAFYGVHVFLEPQSNGYSVRARVYIGRGNSYFHDLGELGTVQLPSEAVARWGTIAWREDGVQIGTGEEGYFLPRAKLESHR